MPISTHDVRLRTVEDAAGSAVRLDMHDGVKYYLEWYHLGEPTVDETWIHPSAGGVGSYLARTVPRPVKMTIILHVLPTGAADHATLRTNLRAVRNEFDDRENYLEVGMSSTVFDRFHTWPSPIAHAIQDDDRSLQRAIATRRVLDWRFEVWRDATPINDPNHMPVI